MRTAKKGVRKERCDLFEGDVLHLKQCDALEGQLALYSHFEQECSDPGGKRRKEESPINKVRI